jgi:translation elongation factor EF-G
MRLPKICKKLLTFEKSSKGYTESEKEELKKLREAVERCDNSPDAPLVIYISKMINIPKENINEHGLINPGSINYDIQFTGFARVFSGVLKRGTEVYIISSKTKGDDVVSDVKYEVSTAKIDTIYIQMSQYLEGVSEVPAGNCVGIGDLDNVLYKTATVSSCKICPSFSPMHFGVIIAYLHNELGKVSLEGCHQP